VPPVGRAGETAGNGERARIVEAAYRCLSEKTSVSVTEILAAAGLGTRAFYRHFGSKDELLLAMLRRDAERVLAELRGVVEAASSPLAALAALIEHMLALTADGRRRHRVTVMTSEEVMKARGYPAEWLRVQREQDALIAGILRAGLADGSLPWADPESDARAIRAAMAQAFEDQMSGAAAVPADRAAAQVTSFALRALGARR